MNAKDLQELGEGLFGKRSSLTLLWQEQAENFYPERADFTVRRTLGTDFAGDLMTSYPLLCRRELGDQIGQMLRPTAKQWHKVALSDPDRETNAAKQWLERAGTIMHRAMYDRKTLFTRAMKEADHDYAAFGQRVVQIRVNRNGDALLYRSHHLRDVAWQENEDGSIGMIFRKWKPTMRDLKRLFGAKVHQKVDSAISQKKLNEECECMHMIVDADMYDDNAKGRPFWSIYYDCENQHILEAVPVWNKEYNIARWQTVSGSQYAFSPATVAALPDARLLQAMTYTLLEAGEKYTNPPMVATMDAVRSDVSIYSGGITWVDRDYDERLGEALRPIKQDKGGMPIGVDMQNDSRQMLMQAFFLNKLNLPRPEAAGQMTAYEVGQRIQEYIRGALPIFEPMEIECNGADCELTFDILLRHGAFGSPQDMPKELSGADFQFRFESPLHDAIEQQKGQKYLEMNQYISQAVQLDGGAINIPDSRTALRDVLMGVGVPAKWIRDEATVEKMIAQQTAQAQTQEALANMQAGADVTSTLATAQKDRSAAGV
jgi:hypothetical protein